MGDNMPDVEEVLNGFYKLVDDIMRQEVLEHIKKEVGDMMVASIIDAIGEYTVNISKLRNMADTIEQEVERRIDKILLMHNRIHTSNFKFVGYKNNLLWYFYDGTVYAEHIKFDDRIYSVPEYDEFYVAGILVAIDLNGRIAEGYCDESFHPNATQYTELNLFGTEWNKLCLGDLDGKDMSNIDKVPDLFKIINMDSAYEQAPYEMAMEYINGEYVEHEGSVFVSWEVFR